MPDSAKGSTSHPNFARFAQKNPQETFGKRRTWRLFVHETDMCFLEDLSDQEFKVWMSKATGVRCTYCDEQGPLVACATTECLNNACVLKSRKVKGCVGLEQFGNKEFLCPGCLLDQGKDIPVSIRTCSNLSIAYRSSSGILITRLSTTITFAPIN